LLLVGTALEALPKLEFDFVKIETIERLVFGLSWHTLPKVDLTIYNLLLHTILRKFRSTSVHSLGDRPNWFIENKEGDCAGSRGEFAKTALEKLKLALCKYFSKNVYYCFANLFQSARASGIFLPIALGKADYCAACVLSVAIVLSAAMVVSAAAAGCSCAAVS
jgi:hypothetical protein